MFLDSFLIKIPTHRLTIFLSGTLCVKLDLNVQSLELLVLCFDCENYIGPCCLLMG